MTNAPEESATRLSTRSAGGAFWVMLEGGFAQFLALIAFAIIARFTDPHVYGLVAVSLALLEMVRAVLVDVLATVLTSDRLARLRDWHGAYWITLGWCLGLTLLAAAAAPLLALAFRMPDLTPVLQLLSLNIFFYGLGRIPEGYLTQAMRFRPLALRTLCAVVIGGAGGVAAAIAGWGVYALILQQLVTPAVSSVLVILLAQWRPSLRISMRRFRRHLNHAVTLTPNALAYVVGHNLDVLVVSLTMGATASGLYNLARRLRLAVQMMFLGLGRVALAAFTSLDSAPDRIGPAFVRGAQLIAILAAPVFIGMALVGEELLALAFGPKWSAAAPILAILMIAGPVLVFNDYLEQLLVSRRRLAQLARTKLGYIVVLAILLFASSRFGWVGIAWAGTIAAALLTPAMLRIAARSTPIDLTALARALAGPAIACAAMAVAVSLLRTWLHAQPNSLRMAILIPAGAATYGVCLFFVSRDAFAMLMTMARRLTSTAHRTAPGSAQPIVGDTPVT